MSLAAYWRWQTNLAEHEEEEVPIIVSQSDSGDFQPCPEGLHQAVCVDVVDKGMVETQFGKKHKLAIIWQVLPLDDDGNPMTQEDGSRFQVQSWYTASLHKKSMLYAHLNAWRGRAFTDEELAGFDLEKLIGANCQIQVVHSAPKDGKVYGNLQAIVQYKGKDKLKPMEYVRVQDREEGGEVVPDEEPLPF